MFAIRQHYLKRPDALDYNLAISRASREASEDSGILHLFENTGNQIGLTDLMSKTGRKTVGQPVKDIDRQNWNTTRLCKKRQQISAMRSKGRYLYPGITFIHQTNDIRKRIVQFLNRLRDSSRGR